MKLGLVGVLISLVCLEAACGGGPSGSSLSDTGGTDYPDLNKPMIFGRRVQGSSDATTVLDSTVLVDDISAWCYSKLESDVESTTSEWLCADAGNLDGGAASCPTQQCYMHLNLCVGHKLMEIADAVSPVTWSSARFQKTGPGGSYSFPLQVPEAAYTIPPQSAQDRTAAYELAVKSFSAAGERGVAAITSCMTGIMGTNTAPLIRDNQAELFTVAYADVIQALAEAIKKLARNQLQVAGHRPQEIRDRALAGESMWNGTFNSARAAAAALAASDTSGSPLSLPFVSSGPQHIDVRRAVDFIRDTPISQTLDTVAAVSEVTYLTKLRQDYVARFPAADVIPAEPDSSFFARMGLHPTDIIQARRYLKEEHTAFGRTKALLPGTNHVAGLTTPPQPFPTGVALLKTAGTRTIPVNLPDSTMITHPSYRASGALQSLDYLRWGAERALRQSKGTPSLLTPRLRPIFVAASQTATSQVGRRRLSVTSSGTTTTVKIYGASASDRFALVSSLDAARCLTEGSNDGGPCGTPSSLILDDTATFAAGNTLGQEMDGTLTYTFTNRTGPVILLEATSFGGTTGTGATYQSVAGFESGLVPSTSNTILMPFADGDLPDSLTKIVQGDATVPERPSLGCGGQAPDLGVPLESELTDDSDAYESSWQHYLDLAVQMAAEADGLGEQLIDQGLSNDMRAEGAIDELEAICGPVQGYSSMFSEATPLVPDPSLSHCLPPDKGGTQNTLLPWVALGDRQLCAWQNKQARLPCVCSDGDAFCSGANFNACPAEPLVENSCAGVFPGLPAAYELLPAPAGGVAGLAQPLGIVASEKPPSSTANPTVACENLADLRSGVLDDDARRERIRALRGQDWFSQLQLLALFDNAELDENWPYGMELTVGGVSIMSLDDTSLAPRAAATRVAGNVFNKAAPALFPVADTNTATLKSDYIRSARRAFVTLGLLSGSTFGNLRRSRAFRAEHCTVMAGQSVLSECRAIIGESQHDPPDNLSVDACEERGGCRCLTTAPVGAHNYGNVQCDHARYDATPVRERIGGSTAHLNHLWNVGESTKCGSARAGSVSEVLCNPPSDGELAGWRATEYYHGEDATLWFLGDQPDPHLSTENDEFINRTPTHDDVYNALGLACYLKTLTSDGCPAFNPNSLPSLPPVTSIGDLRRLENRVACAVSSVRNSASRVILANIPEVLADSAVNGRALTLYPGYQGEQLEGLKNLQVTLNRISSDMAAVANLLESGILATSQVRNSVKRVNAQQQVQSLQLVAQTLAMVAQAVAGTMTSFGASEAAMPAMLLVEQLIADAQDDVFEAELQGVFLQYSSQVSDILHQVQVTVTDINNGVAQMNADLGHLAALRNRALDALARASFQGTSETGRVYPVTSVMRARYNTLQKRYEKARDRARRMAFVARRAIEQRFGVDLSAMNDDLTLVPAPATWADDLCTFEGIDYERIRQAADPEDEPEVNYVDGYLGDYVRDLQLFAETYPFDFPFQDGSDLAVVSLRDDLLRSKSFCDVPVANLLASSDQFSSTVQTGDDEALSSAWRVEGCAPLGGAEGSCLNLQSIPDLIVDGRRANRVADANYSSLATPGILVQDVEFQGSGATLLLSWRAAYVAPPVVENLQATPATDYKMRLENLTTGAFSEVRYPMATVTAPAVPAQRTLTVAARGPGTIRVTIDPSADAGKHGDVWISELQLEAMSTGAALVPTAFIETNRDGLASLEICPDLDGAAMRQAFTDGCYNICSEGFAQECRDGGDNVVGEECYMEVGFGIALDAIERGDLIPSGAIALGNYNYRHDLVAVNLVGTNVRDCSRAESPATCYANGFVPVTLEHIGNQLPVRNHVGDTLDFDFGVGFIEHGKALASEAVLTNPLSGSMESLIQPYYKREFRGRPIAGQYRLRVWNDETLNWGNVEDVQFVFRYRYWTRFER